VERWRALGWLIVLANLAGLAFGLYYYAPQLARHPPWEWLFVMDSPVAVGLFALALALALRARRVNWLTHLAGMANFKVGVWTLFVILYLDEWFLAPERAAWYGLLFALHVGMVLSGLWVLGATRADWKLSAALLAWFLFNDCLDYGLGLHPVLPAVPYELMVVGWVTAGLSAFTVAWFHRASWDRPNLLGFLPVIGGELRSRTVAARAR
jgi:uncharacterized membrane protein YpjA